MGFPTLQFLPLDVSCFVNCPGERTPFRAGCIECRPKTEVLWAFKLLGWWDQSACLWGKAEFFGSSGRTEIIWWCSTEDTSIYIYIHVYIYMYTYIIYIIPENGFFAQIDMLCSMNYQTLKNWSLCRMHCSSAGFGMSFGDPRLLGHFLM
jgi:hypothetical protein